MSFKQLLQDCKDFDLVQKKNLIYLVIKQYAKLKDITINSDHFRISYRHADNCMRVYFNGDVFEYFGYCGCHPGDNDDSNKGDKKLGNLFIDGDSILN